MRWLALAALCACHGSSAKHDVDAPAGDVDAAVDAAAACEIPANLGTVTGIAKVDALWATDGNNVTNLYEVDNVLTSDPVYDVISLEVYKLGAFAAGYPTTFPVTVPLTGAELDFATCGACVRGFGDVTGAAWKGEYFATSGSVTLTALSKTRIAGKLVNVTLVHVRQGTPHTRPLNDGCMTFVGELAFDAAPHMGVAADPHVPTSGRSPSL